MTYFTPVLSNYVSFMIANVFKLSNLGLVYFSGQSFFCRFLQISGKKYFMATNLH